MLIHIVLACALTLATTFVHAGAMFLSLRTLKFTHVGHWARRSSWAKTFAVSVLVLMMSIASLVEAFIWSVVFVAIGALSDLHQALYFSIVTFTTLGYGDVTLGKEWQLLSSFEAANGIILFGWTTALIVAAVHHMYFASPPAPCAEK